MPALTLPNAGGGRGGNAATQAGASGNAPVNQGGQQAAPTITIPFTRASPMKSKAAPVIGPTALTAGQANFGPYQIPSGGFFRKLKLNCVGVTAGNAATVTQALDGPWNLLQQIGLLSASGGQIIYSIDGYLLYAWNKYGVLSTSAPGTDPKIDPSYSFTTGAGATAGSFNFNIDIPLEIDSRDALGVLPNMAGNQLFQLSGSLNTSASLYIVPPTTPPTVTVTPVYEFWALPEAANADSIPQAQYPPGIGSAILIQNQNPVINPGNQQKIQLQNVGQIHRVYLFILRLASGARDTTNANWPTVTTRYVNGNPFNYKTKSNWLRQQCKSYGLLPTYETVGGLDQGVMVWSDFVTYGDGSEVASSACNRNLWPVTERSSVLEFDFNAWGASASTLLISTLSVSVPSPEALYQPYVA